MNKIIAQIHHEHKNISKVLNILEKEINLFDEGKTADFNLIRDIINYMADYPHHVHHPKEDVMLEQLLKKDPKNSILVTKLQEDHLHIAMLTKQFAEFIDEILSECIFPREQISAIAHKFLNNNIKHMENEETKLLPTVEKTFNEADWRSIADNIPNEDDPLFGKSVSNQYQALFDHIVRSQPG